jgi:hypothetical protein
MEREQVTAAEALLVLRMQSHVLGLELDELAYRLIETRGIL